MQSITERLENFSPSSNQRKDLKLEKMHSCIAQLNILFCD